MNAFEYAKDNDYALTGDAFDNIRNDDELSKEFNDLVAEHIRGMSNLDIQCRHLRLMMRMVHIAAQTYEDFEYDNTEQT